MSTAVAPAGEDRRSANGTTASARVVHLPPGGDLARLLGGCPPGLVFTPAERRYCGRRADLTGWAGRLAAKLAVADLLGIGADRALAEHRDVGLARIEILPAPSGLCPDGAGCTKPHPPRVRLGGDVPIDWGEDGRVDVSISHTRALAVALAVRGEPAAMGQP